MGLQSPRTVDLVAYDKAADCYRLVLVESGPWDGSRAQLGRLQEKLNSYLGFALDGRMGELYPGAEAKDVVIRLELAQAPDPRTRAVLVRLEAAIREHGLGFELVVTAG